MTDYERFKAFTLALEALCKEHRVIMYVNIHDGITVADDEMFKYSCEYTNKILEGTL